MDKQSTQNNGNIKKRMSIVATIMQGIINTPIFQAALLDETKPKVDDFKNIPIEDEISLKQVQALQKSQKEIDDRVAKELALEEKTFRAKQKLYGTTVNASAPRSKKALTSEQVKPIKDKNLEDKKGIER